MGDGQQQIKLLAWGWKQRGRLEAKALEALFIGLMAPAQQLLEMHHTGSVGFAETHAAAKQQPRLSGSRTHAWRRTQSAHTLWETTTCSAVIHWLLAQLNVWTILIALIGGSLEVRRQFSWPRWADRTLLWIAFWVLGINGLWGFIYHFFFGEFSAELIGWPNSPFQYEVAYANLTIAILGFSSWWLKRRDYLLAAMVAYISWFFADGLGHAVALVSQNDTAPDNAGTILFTDLLMPVVVAVLLKISGRRTP